MTSVRDRLANRIGLRARELLQQAQPLYRRHGARLPEPLIRFDLSGQAAGQVEWKSGHRPLMRFNLDIAERHCEDFLARTVTHEVAHLVTAACHGRTRPHGVEWRAVMAFFGQENATRCHDYTLDQSRVRRQQRWVYRCECNGNHLLSTTRHKRSQSGAARYHCRRCRGVLAFIGADPD